MTIGIHIGAPLVENLNMWFTQFPSSNVAQIFTHGPHGKKENNFDRSMVKQLSITKHIYVHTSYLTTFSNMDHIEEQFETARAIDAEGVVVHIPKMGVAEVADAADKIVRFSKGVKLLLEMKAVTSHPLNSYESPEKINTLIEALSAKGLSDQHVGIVIDTAHIAAGGQHIRRDRDALLYLQKLKYPDYIALLHLNGNEFDGQQRASDKHILPFRRDIDGDTNHCDTIWSGRKYDRSGCKVFIEWFLSRSKNIIIECAWDDHLVKFINMIQP